VADIVHALSTLRKYGIKTHGMFVLGADSDTADTIRETARFARLQFLVALVVADGADRPAWNKGDFFERFLKPERPARR